MSARVSVCTSVKNQSVYLRRMIESVRAQTLQEWELIIVDDGSDEDITSLVQSFNDTRIVFERWPVNRGIPHGLNYAFTMATGDYVQPLSADEWITPDKLKEQVEYLDANPGVGCVWGLPGKGEMGKRPEWEQNVLRAHNRSQYAWIRTLLRMEQIPIGGASMLMRRDIMNELGGFDPEFFHCSDLELFVRFFQGHVGMILPYRWADADQPADRLTAPSPENATRFREDVDKLHAKHKLVLPPNKGRVTVGIPVYNMAQFISKALQSLDAQTVQDFDIIILDDASTDNLAEVIAPWKDRIKFQRFEENQGVRAAVNAMIAQCETEFFMSLAADDWIEPTFIEKCLKEFESDPFLEFVASQTSFADAAGVAIPPDTHDLQRIERAVNKTRDQWLQRLYYGNVYFGVGMGRAYALREVGGLNKTDGILCDYDLYLKLLQRENIRIVEEPLTVTRVHDGMASYGAKKFDQQWLVEKYSEIRRRYYQPRMKCIIATPFYEMRGFSPYIASLAATVHALTRLGIEHVFWELSGDSYVDRAKNTLFNKFLEDPDATDLFMVDSDMQWEPQAFVNMLMLPEAIVMGSYPQKNMWEVYTARPEFVKVSDTVMNPIGRILNDGSGLLKAEYLAGGFIRIKREALIAYKEHFKEKVYYDHGADPAKPDRLYTEFFCCERATLNDVPMRWGEDRVFGRRLKEIGIDSWIYTKATFGHYGIKGWMGNYDKYLRGQSQPQGA